MSDTTAGDTATGDFERYGLLAALTLVVLSLLLVDRVRSVRPAVAVPPADRVLRLRIGGTSPSAPAQRAAASATLPAAPAAVAHAPAQTAPPRTVPPGSPANPAAARRTAPPAQVRPAPAATVVPRTCVVESGETLGDIASRELGSARRAREIAELNGLRSVDEIRAGQSLRLPPR